MRRTTFAITLTLLLLTTMTVPTGSAEIREYHYDAAGYGFVWDVCWDINNVDPGVEQSVCGLNGGQIQLGGVQNMETPNAYAGVIIGVNDALGSDPMIIGAYSEEVGGFTEETWGHACGPITHFGREAPLLNLFVHALDVTDDLKVCIGSSGDVVANFF